MVKVNRRTWNASWSLISNICPFLRYPTGRGGYSSSATYASVPAGMLPILQGPLSHALGDNNSSPVQAKESHLI